MKHFANVSTLRYTLDAYGACCKPLCKELGLSRMAFDILMFLANNPECFTAKDICHFRGFKENIVSMNVTRLVEEGYLERSVVEGDRRKVRLVVTPKADYVIERGREVQRAFMMAIGEGLTKDEVEVFAHCLDVITGNAKRMIRECGREEET